MRTVFYFFLSLIFSSCANLKIIEKSAREKPSWIYGIEKDFLVGEGKGSDYNEAKYDALQMVKEKIVSAVAQNISFVQNIKVNETRYKRAIEFLEEYTSEITSKTGNTAYLQGISLSKATDYYWEKQRENRIEKVFYYIKYPFTESDIQVLIKEWEKQEKQLTQRLDTLKLNNAKYKTVEDIVEEIEELKYLSDIFVDQRKTTAEISIQKLEGKLNSIHVIPDIDTLGFYKYHLQLGNDTITTIQEPNIKSNCAEIKGINTTRYGGSITYTISNCLVENKNFIAINYEFGDWSLLNKVNFDVSSKKIFIENNSDISFSSLDKSLFKKDHVIKCHLTIYSKSSVPFKINKIELLPKLCKSNCNRYYNYKSYPVIIVENINKHFCGRGNHSFEVIAYVPKSQTNHWASGKGLSTKISGKIYYSSEVTSESRICEFTDLKYYTNW